MVSWADPMVRWEDPPPRVKQTDADYLLDLLRDGRELTGPEILRYSQHERGVGMTIHSRISELRNDRGHTITTRCLGHKNGRNIYAYRLVALRERDTSGPEGSRSRSAPDTVAPLAGDSTATNVASPLSPSEAAVESPAPQLSLELPGSTYRKDIAA